MPEGQGHVADVTTGSYQAGLHPFEVTTL